jgi:acetoin utilization deacetylase AcuC-like enzyme
VPRTAWLTDNRMFDPPPGPFVGFIPANGVFDADEHAADRLAMAAVRRVPPLLQRTGLMDHLLALPVTPATREQLAWVHDEDYLDRVHAMARGAGGWIGNHTWLPAGGDTPAALAAGACIGAVEAVLDGKADTAYSLVWPPGHHALAHTGAGFCVYANAALAAHAALAAGLERVAIVDWDAHLGDGTHAAFAGSNQVLTVSVHQAKPGPQPAPIGGSVDIGLPLGAGPAAFSLAFAEVVEPALSRLGPELIIVSCGYDASVLDPMARLALHSRAFGELTRRLQSIADRCCHGRIVVCHEGGYSPAYVPVCVHAVVEELSGVHTGFRDPFLARWKPFAGDRLRDDDVVAVDLARLPRPGGR